MPKLVPVFITFIVVANCFIACSSTLQKKNHSEESRVAEHRIYSGDVVEISFDYYPDFNQTVVVSPDGKIALKALNEFKVKGITIVELRKRLVKKYQEILSTPVLDVKVHQPSKLSVYVGGDLNKPGMLKFKRNLTIVQGILLAGGLKEQSRSYKIFVFRNRGKEGIKMYKFMLNESWRKDKSKRNFKLAPYDVVFVVEPKTHVKTAKRVI